MDVNLTDDLNKQLEKDLLRHNPPARPGNGLQVKAEATHRERIDALITEVQMTLRILEEAKKRL